MAKKNTKGAVSLYGHRNANEASARETKNMANNKPAPTKLKTTTYEMLDDSLRETLDKFYRSEVYIMSDVYETLKIICERNKLDFENHCIPAVCLLTVDEKLKKLKTQRPLYIVYWDLTDMWTLTTIAPINDEDYVLFNHPTGKDIPYKLLNVIKPYLNKFTDDHLSCNTVNSCKDIKKKIRPVFSGPIVLRNMVFLHQEINNGFQKDFFDSFKNYEFATALDVNKEKLEIAEHMATILTTDNADFVLSCKKFFKMLEVTYPIKERVDLYAELKDKDEIKRMTDAVATSSPRPNLMKERTAGQDDNISDEVKKYFEDNEKYIPLIGKEYKKHARSLEIILTIVKYSIQNSAKDTCIKSIREKFGIEERVMTAMMIIDPKQKEKEEEEEEGKKYISKIPELQNPEDLWGKSKEKKPKQETKPTKDTNEKTKSLKSLQEIQDQIVYRGTVNPISGHKSGVTQIHSGDAAELNKLYGFYEQSTGVHGSKSREGVYKWCKDNRNKINGDKQICEALAVANRALQLVEGYTMRHPQVCSCLIMLLMSTNKDNGKLLQIQTGEGKTFTIGITAAVLVLQGHKVDVITSNNILANEGVDNTKALTNLLGISVGCNKRMMDINKSDRDSGISSGTADAPTAFNIKATDSDQEKKKKHEQQMEYYNKKNKYTEDIVYGAISNFQFDYLKATIEGTDERKGRPFDYVILDEVDSMLIDNGGHVAKLAEPFPGMENLRSLYIKIWQELGNKIYKSNDSQKQNVIDMCSKELNDNKGNSELAMQNFERKFMGVLDAETINIKDDLVKEMKTYIAKESSLIPHHIQAYLRSNMHRLVENAYFAKYGCDFEKNYIIEGDPPINDKTPARGSKPKNGKVVPVDNENTGVTMKETIWSYGLHQFVQLKHHLQLTFETLTTSFISNLGYVRLYGPSDDGKTGYRILGVTGTMGADDKNKVDEKDVFKAICNNAVDFFGIPPYIETSFEQGDHSAVDDEQWLSTVVVETMEKIRDYRSVLIICETIRDVYNLEYIFNNVVIAEGLTPTIMENGIRILAVEADAEKATEKHVSCREVIIATNLAGRGTDFKTTKCLNKHGGIHVIVGFLPCNARVQGQAFGRTARQGNKGTASMIVRKTDLNGKDPAEYMGFNNVIIDRDEEANKNLKKIKEKDLPEITFKDGLFKKFAEQYQILKKEIINKPGGTIVLRDVKEHWAFWLEIYSMQHVEIEKINTKTIMTIIDSRFWDFRKAESRLDSPSTAIDEKTVNPYYDILRVREFTMLGQWDDGKTVFERMKLEENDKKIMYAYHMCKFEIDFQCNRNVMWEKILKGIREKIKNLLSKILPKFLVDEILKAFDKLLETNKHEAIAISNLKNAEAALKKEMDQITNMSDSENTVFKEYVLESSERLIDEPSAVQDNEFLKHMVNRLKCLKMYEANIVYLKEKMDDVKGSNLYIIEQKVSVNNGEVLKRYGADNLKEEANEFFDSGYDSLYYLEKVQDIDYVKGGIGLASAVAGGLLLLAGIYFPPIGAISLKVGLDLLQSGIVDIIMALLTTESSNSDIRTALYEKLKEVSQSIISSIVSLGFAKLNSVIVNKALHVLQTMNRALQITRACAAMFGVFSNSKFIKDLKTVTDKLQSLLDAVPSAQGKVSRKDYVSGIKGALSRDIPLRILAKISAPAESNTVSVKSGDTNRLLIQQIITEKKGPSNSAADAPPQSESWSTLNQPTKNVVTDFCETSSAIAKIVGNVVKAYQMAKADPDKLALDPTKQDIENAGVDLIQRLNHQKLIQDSDKDAVKALLSSHIMFRAWKVTQALLPPRRFEKKSFFNQVPDAKRFVLEVVDECALDPNYSDSSKLTMAKLKKKIPIMDELYLDKALLMTRYDLYFEDNTDHKTSPRYKMIKDLRGNVDQQQTCGCEEEIQQIEKEKREKQN